MPATFIFYIREERSNARGECPVYLKITHNRKRKYIDTGIKISSNDWNETKQQVRRRHRNYNKLNEELDIIRANAEQAYRELNRDKRASSDAIKKRLEYASKDNFFELSQEYLANLQASGQFWTHKQANVAIGKLREFHGSDHLPLNLIDADFISRFQDRLRKKNKASTIRKNFRSIKGVLRIAVRQKLIPYNPFDSDEFELIKNDSTDTKTKLTIDQIKAIESLMLKPDSILWHARNAFLLSFYFCGMRFGDLAELRWSNIKNGRLEYNMNKTGNPISIPVKEGAMNILDAYQGNKNKGYVFPFLAKLSLEEQVDPVAVRRRISSWNAQINGQATSSKKTGLKAIADKAGINEDVSMHVARHTFAQFGVNDRNIPPYKMMMLLGHKSIETTMKYLKSLDVKTVDNVMDEIF